jgi:NTP pyrophosphatase (non-canonical NTP hydrolase)
MKQAKKLEFQFTNQMQSALISGLYALMNTQLHVSAVVGAIPPLHQSASPDQIRTYFLALIREVSELLEEFNWKPWKAEKEINTEKIAEEFADVLAFLGILLVYAQCVGVFPSMLGRAYADKTAKNVSRFNGEVEGYDLTR